MAGAPWCRIPAVSRSLRKRLVPARFPRAETGGRPGPRPEQQILHGAPVPAPPAAATLGPGDDAPRADLLDDLLALLAESQEIIPGQQDQKRPGKNHCRNQDCHVDLPFQTLMETMRFIASMPMNIITKAPATIHRPTGSRNRISM